MTTSAFVERNEALVCGVGARTATGLDAQQAALTWRAGKSWPRTSPLVDRAGEPIATCRLASIPDDVTGRARLAEIAAPPLVEALGAWKDALAARRQDLPPVALLLARPRPDRQGDRLLGELAERASVRLDEARSREFTQGRAAGVAAVAEAMRRLAHGEDEAIAVGGVDSLYDPARLEELDGARRLHGPACENGFIPGEGAAFVVLARRAVASPLARVLAASVENEPRPFGSPDPTHALGMTLAARNALQAASASRMDWIVSDVVYERHRVDEWLFVSGRLQEMLAPGARHDQPLLSTGELGAATAPMLLALACALWRAEGAPSEHVLMVAHSDGSARGALVARRET